MQLVSKIIIKTNAPLEDNDLFIGSKREYVVQKLQVKIHKENQGTEHYMRCTDFYVEYRENLGFFVRCTIHNRECIFYGELTEYKSEYVFIIDCYCFDHGFYYELYQ